MPNDQSMVDAIASKVMGVEPQAPAPAAPQAPVAPAAPAEKDTPTDKAIEAGSPNDEAAKMTADPVIYEIEMGDGKKRKLTPEQIKGMTDRYSSLNYKHAQMKPVLDIVDAMLKNNPNAKPEHVAQFMMSMMKAGEKSPTMGQPQQPQQNQQQPPDVDPFAKWEEDNSATLPPGYREMMQGNNGVMNEIAQLKQMLGQVLASSQGVADAARAGQTDARQNQIASIQRSIANNVDRAQSALQLPDSEAENFMTFAAERGYSLEDFVDPSLTLAVMRDYKNNMNSPEFERLAQINKRRQAWTGGAMGGTPSAAGTPPVEGTGNAAFDALTKTALAKRQR